MGLSPAWADNLANLIVQTTGAPAGLPDLTLTVYTVLPDPDGLGGVEPPAVDGFAGAQPAVGSTLWSESTGGNGENETLTDIDFGTPTAAWDPIVGCALLDDTGALFSEPVEFDDPLEAVVGEPFVLTAGTVVFRAA